MEFPGLIVLKDSRVAKVEEGIKEIIKVRLATARPAPVFSKMANSIHFVPPCLGGGTNCRNGSTSPSPESPTPLITLAKSLPIRVARIFLIKLT